MALRSFPRRVILSGAAFFSGAKDLLFAMSRSARTWVPHVSLLRRGKATNRPSAHCHPERPREKRGGIEGSAVAFREAFIRKNLGAPSLLSKGGKATNPKITFALKSAQALLLALAVCFSVGATDASSRYNNLNHRLMCTCSCAQLLGECNHVGCPASGPMLNELSAAIASGATDEQILTSFSAKYGVTVLAAPPTHGFSLVAWIAPIAVFAAALLGTILLVRHWSVGQTLTPAAQSADPAMNALRDKIRRETEASDL
jgi:cytochrome c-type biogenesis protein CcmH/NrfF